MPNNLTGNSNISDFFLLRYNVAELPELQEQKIKSLHHLCHASCLAQATHPLDKGCSPETSQTQEFKK